MRGPATLVLLLAMMGTTTGCGDDDVGRTDAGSDAGDAGGDGGAVVPAPPRLGPCPDGWRELSTGDELLTCEPWPEGGAIDCGAGEAHFPGGAGCEPVGTPCGAGERATDLPSDRPIIYVRAGAATGGDGTMGSPHARIRDGVRATADGVVAVGKGTYSEIVDLRSGSTVHGACAAETVIQTTVGGALVGGLRPLGPDVMVRNLTVGESPRTGIFVTADADIRAEGVVVDRTTEFGLWVEFGGRLVANGLVVRDIQPTTTGAQGRGAHVQEGGVLEVARGAFERNRVYGVFVSGPGSSVRLTSVAVRGTLADEKFMLGRGIEAQFGGAAEVADSVFEHNLSHALFVGGRSADDLPASLLVTGTVARETGSRPLDRLQGIGIALQEGGVLTVRRSLVERNPFVGLAIFGEHSTYALSDVVVRDQLGSEADGAFGRGINITSLATGSIETTAVLNNRAVGILVAEDATATLRDVQVHDILEAACADTTCGDSTFGMGLVSTQRGTIDVQRFSIRASALCGMQVARDGSLDASFGTVADCAIGACVQVPAYDFARLTSNVSYTNETNLEATELPVPEPAVPELWEARA